MTDPSPASWAASAIAPGVALTSAVIYWANLQGRLESISIRVRSLNTELRAQAAATPRTGSVQKQVRMLCGRSHVLHVGVVFSVMTLVAFLGSSAVLFYARGHEHNAGVLFMGGMGTFGLSLIMNLWEMLWARRSLDEDIDSSRPPPG